MFINTSDFLPAEKPMNYMLNIGTAISDSRNDYQSNQETYEYIGNKTGKEFA